VLYVTDITPHFQQQAQRFLGKEPPVVKAVTLDEVCS
jgi:hypothetical protein